MFAKKAGLSRQQRITDADQYRAVFDNRLRIHGRFFSFHVMVNSLGVPRLGLAVSRKVSRKAVQRNRIKRQIKESFRHSCGQSVYPMQPSVTKSPAVDFVVVAKIAAANAQNKELRQELDRLWLKASKKCEAS